MDFAVILHSAEQHWQFPVFVFAPMMVVCGLIARRRGVPLAWLLSIALHLTAVGLSLWAWSLPPTPLRVWTLRLTILGYAVGAALLLGPRTRGGRTTPAIFSIGRSHRPRLGR